MGADMMIWIIPAFEMTDKREQILLKFIKDMKEVPAYYDHLDLQDFKDAAIAIIKDYPHLDGRRDVCCVYIKNIPYLMTGGLSWGDTPTDAADSFDYICNWDKFWDIAELWAEMDQEK
jgi:hypothetical protein